MKNLRLVVVCYMFLMLTGCIDNRLREDNEKKANTVQNFLNYKQGIGCEWGKLSAVYRGRIYYFQDGKEPGIYSMDTRGKDKQLEIAVQNIRKLQIREEGIYFAGAIEDAPLNQYTLYVKKWGVEKAEESL